MIYFFKDEGQPTGKYLIITDNLIDMEEYFSSIRINQESFAGILMKNVFKAIIEDLQDLNRIYNKYYNCEFETLEKFLSEKYFIEDWLIDQIKSNKIYYGNLYEKCNYDLVNLILSNEVMYELKRIF